MTDMGLPEQAIVKICQVFRQYPSIHRVILYGSRAMGTHRIGSDIDLCIEAESLGLTDLLSIENKIDDLLLPWKVDLALLHKIDNAALRDHIRRVGVVFYQPAEDATGLDADEQHDDPSC